MDPNATPTADVPHSHNQPAKDDKYFFEDGDCMFVAEGILFKLHKWPLCRDPDSMFRGMFGIPQGQQNMTVLDPISLSEDSAEEFRALCWAVYALPNEIHRQTTRDANVQRLMDAAKMCHKYSLPAFETWALDMIRIQCQPPLRQLATCAQEVLDRIMGLATLCSDAELLDLVEGAWISRLDPGPRVYAVTSSTAAASVAQKPLETDCSAALVAGEKYGRRKFQGAVYYELNKRIYTESSILTSTRGFSYLRLADPQLLRLLSGHVLLSNFWKHLRRRPLPTMLSQCSNLNGHYNCTAFWERVEWQPDSSDVLEDLKTVKNSCHRRSPSPLCVIHHLETLMTRLTTTDIADYFLGPERNS